MTSKVSRLAALACASVVLLLAAGEVGVRLAGAADYPLYDTDAIVGYQPKPNQSGAYLNTYTYAFNNLGMGVAEPFAPSAGDTLLIGDSIVMGPKYLRQEERLGPQLQRITGKRVWPMGAVSWSFLNELNWLNAHAEAQVPRDLIFVSNWLDFGQPSAWNSEQRNPRSAPVSALARTIQARFKDRTAPDTSHPTPEQIRAWEAALNKFMLYYNGHITFVAYPSKHEISGDLSGKPRHLANTFNPLLDIISKQPADRVTLIDLTNDPDWRIDLYHDDLHPKAKAMSVLAKAIARP